MPRPRGCLVAIAVVGVAGLAWGQARSARAIRVAYEAPSGCPNAAELVAEIRARTARVAFDEHAGEVVRVGIERRERRFVGSVTFAGPDGETHRRVEGGTCAEVVSALALVTALAVDPMASITPSSAPASSAPSATDASAVSTASDGGAPTSTNAAPPAPAAASASAAPAPPKNAPPARPTEPNADRGETTTPDGAGRGWRFAIGLDGEGVVGVAPSLVYAAPVFLELANVTGAIVGFDVRARFAYAGTGATSVPGGALDFTWTVGALDVCPLGWSPGRARLVLCARGEGGVLDASGVNILPARSDARPWLTAGLVARGQYRFWGPLFAEAELSGFALITRDRFYFEPSTTAFRAGVAGLSPALGLGATF